MNNTHIFANKQPDGTYAPEEILTDLDHSLSNLEYYDVNNEEYQIWEYPSGKIYLVMSDREVSKENEFSGPQTSMGTIWQPTLKQLGEDKDKVLLAYTTLAK